jgi:hypothetical protein
MPERRLLIKEMWNEFNSFQPYRTTEQRQVVEIFFYAGVIAMWKFLEEVDATQEMIDQIRCRKKSATSC